MCAQQCTLWGGAHTSGAYVCGHIVCACGVHMCCVCAFYLRVGVCICGCAVWCAHVLMLTVLRPGWLARGSSVHTPASLPPSLRGEVGFPEGASGLEQTLGRKLSTPAFWPPAL